MTIYDRCLIYIISFNYLPSLTIVLTLKQSAKLCQRKYCKIVNNSVKFSIEFTIISYFLPETIILYVLYANWTRQIQTFNIILRHMAHMAQVNNHIHHIISQLMCLNNKSCIYKSIPTCDIWGRLYKKVIKVNYS